MLQSLLNVGVVTALVCVMPGVFAAEEKRVPPKDYTVGKPGQSVKPKEMKETVRQDGKTSIVTGQKRDTDGKIVGPHSHSVTDKGKVEYSRTQGGRVVGGGGGVPAGETRGGGASGAGGGIPYSGGGGGRPDKK